MRNLVSADHAGVVGDDPELDLNTHARPKGCHCCSSQPIHRQRCKPPRISHTLTCSSASSGPALPRLKTAPQFDYTHRSSWKPPFEFGSGTKGAFLGNKDIRLILTDSLP